HLPCNVKFKRPGGQDAFKAERRVLADDRVRHLGEGVAFIVAETLEAAKEAAELVVIDVDEEPVAVTAEAALADGAPLVWDEVDGNIAFHWSLGDFEAVDAAIAGAHHVARLKSHVTRVMAHSMEPRGGLMYVDDRGRLVVHPSNQNPYPVRAGLATMLGTDPGDIHVIAGDVGGSFGMKSGIYPEDVLLAFATRKLGRPVRWIADRSEGFLSDDHGRDVLMTGELALDADGNFLALKVHSDINIGAYLSGRSGGLIGNYGGIAGVYRIGKIAADAYGVHTHAQVTAPYRGAGRPEATYIIERLIDIAAHETGADPFELRRQNAVPSEAMPYDTGFRFIYDCGEFEANMREAAQLADRDGFEQRRQDAKARGKLRGLGMSNPIEAAGGPFVAPAKDLSRIIMNDDGTVDLYTGAMSVGQGTETMFSNMIAERLGIDVGNVRYHQGDTDMLPDGRGNGGSSSTGVGGSAVKITLDNLVLEGAKIAAEMLQASADDIAFADGEFSIRDGASSVSISEVAKFAVERNPDGLQASGEFDPPAVTFPNGCHMCEVEIDEATGVLEIVNYTVVEDIGTVMNPVMARGQMHGGIAMGVGQALFENVVYDAESGQLVSGSFMDYTMPRADDMPINIQFKTRPVPTKINPLGAKGIGEAGSVGSIAATINAICDALHPLGVKHIEMPATPARIWAAIQQAKAA
ncbi:MAG: xanthine dehydrogenase family protein molybdopterin-binding subunit, partial [Alphaproteobacteria bacterium]|nr:xanthine dehydrogenase family protein molybdopterin-binding subunit [Alphaproteobacteria bacterium]